jgi:hypothetical protein
MNVAGVCGSVARGYTFHVSETTDRRIGVRKMTKAQRSRAENAAFVFASAFARPLNGRAWAGVPSGTLVSLGRQYANPVHCPATPIGVGSRVTRPDQGGRTVRHIPARPEQLQSPIEIIRAALRDAALSDRPNDAIDVLGAALIRLADLSRVEVARGY